jgi:hypothetical protein
MNQIWLNAVRASQAAANWWDGLSNVVAVYQPIGAASLAASYVNLVNPGVNDAAPGVAPTHDPATGWAFNGAQWLTTGVYPALDRTWSMIARFSGLNLAIETHICGMIALSPERRFSLGRIANAAMYDNTTQFRVSPELTSGVLAFAGNNAYRNGLPDGASTGTSTFAVSHVPIAIAARGRTDTTVDNITAVQIQAIAICSSIQTAPQIAAVSAAMAAL